MSNYETTPEEPTEKDIIKSMRATAGQFNEKYESNPEVISRMEKDGWNLVGVIRGDEKVSEGNNAEKETKIVERGEESLVFQRSKDANPKAELPKDNIHGNYDYE